jgi:hypothetical protein
MVFNSSANVAARRDPIPHQQLGDDHVLRAGNPRVLLAPAANEQSEKSILRSSIRH